MSGHAYFASSRSYRAPSTYARYSGPIGLFLSDSPKHILFVLRFYAQGSAAYVPGEVKES